MNNLHAMTSLIQVLVCADDAIEEETCIVWCSCDVDAYIVEGAFAEPTW